MTNGTEIPLMATPYDHSHDDRHDDHEDDKVEQLTAQEVSEKLQDLCWEAAELDADVTSYEAGGVLTTNEGFTLRLPDRSEFQITILRSR